MNSPNETVAEANDAGVIELQHGIEQTRADMSATLAALETRLSPAEVKEKLGVELEHVEERVRLVVREQLGEAKALVQSELQEAKTLLRAEMNEAEDKIRKGLGDARDTVKKDVQEALTSAKRSVRAATLGKVEDLATTIGDKMSETRDSLVDTVRNNPVPAAVMGVGLVWLLINRSKSASSRLQGGSNGGGSHGGHFLADARQSAGNVVGNVGSAVGHAGDAVGNVARQAGDAASRGLHQVSDAASSALHGASDSVTSLAHQAGEAASHFADQAGDTAMSVVGGAKRGAKSVEQSFHTTLHENPMAVGAVAIALGAVVGFSLPKTEGEDALMGEARDRILHSAGDAAQDAVSSVSHLADEALQKVKAPKEESAHSA